MTSIKSLFRGTNPIIVKELRSRMRGPRAFILLTTSLLLMSGISYLLYKITLINVRYSGMPASPQVGQSLFAGLIFMEMVMICAITPAITAGSISGEKEKQTYEMLLATPLPTASILWGKLVSALSYVFVLLFAAVPLASLIFMFGGVTVWDMVKALVILIVTAILVGVIGLFCSALLGRTGRATVVSYAIVLGLTFAFPFASMAAQVFNNTTMARWLMAPSPLAALFSALSSIFNSSGGSALFSLIGWLFYSAISYQYDVTAIPRPIYHYSLPFFALLTVLLYVIACRLVLPVRRWKPKLKEWLFPTLVILAVIGATVAAFMLTADKYENAVQPGVEDLLKSSVMVEPAMNAGDIFTDEVTVNVVEITPTPTEYTGEPVTITAEPAP